MRAAPDGKKDRSASLNRLSGPKVPWRVEAVKALPNYCLEVRFRDGLQGTVEMSKLIWGTRAGVFEKLRNPDLFAQVHVEFGAVTWPGDLDLAPDAMYDQIKAHGKWVLPGRRRIAYREPVESSSLLSIGYDPEEQVLEAEFVDGSVYRYEGVPPELHLELITAPSLGRYFNAHIRDDFKGERVS
jgi:hypothetical protein